MEELLQLIANATISKAIGVGSGIFRLRFRTGQATSMPTMSLRGAEAPKQSRKALFAVCTLTFACSYLPAIRWWFFHVNCGDAMTHNFCRSGCVFNVVWSQYYMPGLCDEVTGQVFVDPDAQEVALLEGVFYDSANPVRLT